MVPWTTAYGASLTSGDGVAIVCDPKASWTSCLALLCIASRLCADEGLVWHTPEILRDPMISIVTSRSASIARLPVHTIVRHADCRVLQHLAFLGKACGFCAREEVGRLTSERFRRAFVALCTRRCACFASGLLHTVMSDPDTLGCASGALHGDACRVVAGEGVGSLAAEGLRAAGVARIARGLASFAGGLAVAVVGDLSPRRRSRSALLRRAHGVRALEPPVGVASKLLRPSIVPSGTRCCASLIGDGVRTIINDPKSCRHSEDAWSLARREGANEKERIVTSVFRAVSTVARRTRCRACLVDRLAQTIMIDAVFCRVSAAALQRCTQRKGARE